MISEVHWGIGGVAALGTVIHLHPLMLACVQDVFSDILCTVRSDKRNIFYAKPNNNQTFQ